MENSSVSLIIPTRNCINNKHYSIFFALKAAEAQVYENMEIIVIDDGGSDGAVQKISEDFPRIKIIRNKNDSGIAGARNFGASQSNGDILIFMDDDMLMVDENCISKVVSSLEFADFCCGANRLWTTPNWQNRIRSQDIISSTINGLLSSSYLPIGVNRIFGYRDLHEFTFLGNFGAITRNCFEKIGGYDEAYKGWGLEDTDLMMRLCWNGCTYKLLKDLNISIIHLNHTVNTGDNFVENLNRFAQKEILQGAYFKVNHFFGVYEDDGVSLFIESPTKCRVHQRDLAS